MVLVSELGFEGGVSFQQGVPVSSGLGEQSVFATTLGFEARTPADLAVQLRAEACIFCLKRPSLLSPFLFVCGAGCESACN